MPTVHRREVARRDLIEHFVYLAENASIDIAERVLAQAEASFDGSASSPKPRLPKSDPLLMPTSP